MILSAARSVLPEGSSLKQVASVAHDVAATRQKLGAFRDQASPADQKAARAKEKLLDDFADSVMRR